MGWAAGRGPRRRQVVSIGSFIILIDESTVRLWLKDHQNVTEKLVQQQAAASQAQFKALRAESRSRELDLCHQGNFSLLNTPVEQRLQIVGFNLEGAAAKWFRWMTRNGLSTTWNRFEESVKNRFGPSKYEDSQGALSKLLQLGTVEDYQREFEKLMNRVTYIPEYLLISFYVLGLKLHLQRALLVSRPVTLGDMFALARITEAYFKDQTTLATGVVTKPMTSVGTQRQVMPRLGGPLMSVNTVKPLLLPKPTGPSKPLEQGHKYSGKFLLLMTNEEDDPRASTVEVGDDAIESGDISILNSLIGHGSPLGCHRKTVLNYQLYEGVQGKVTHDYAQQTMEFTLLNKTYSLKGDDSFCVKKINLHQMQALLDQDEIYGVYKAYSFTKETVAAEMLYYFKSRGRDGSQEGEIRAGLAGAYISVSGTMVFGTRRWGEQEASSFDSFKQQLLTAPILRLPDFNQMFMVKADASDNGISAVLLQNGQPISYFNRKLMPRMLIAATYQKELFTIMEAVYKWHQYL
ncbi:ty3-gypsy retrotransposon protein, partial [Tanacetum coccineum]